MNSSDNNNYALTGHGDTEFTIATTFHIEDIDVYNEYTTALLRSKDDSTKWTLKCDTFLFGAHQVCRGSPKVKTGSLSFSVHYDKSISFQGMDGLSNVTIVGFDLPRNSPEGGVELLLNVSQYNPSIMSVDIGDLTFEILFEGSYMGQVRASNFTLQPGVHFS